MIKQVFIILILLKTTDSYLLNQKKLKTQRTKHHASLDIQDTTDESFLKNFGEGIVLNGVKLTSIGSEKIRGILATAPIDGTTPIVTVPAKNVLEITNNRPPTPFPDFVSQKTWENSLWYHRLSFKLLYENFIDKSEKIDWFKQFPKSFSTPFHWSEKDLLELQYPSLNQKVTTQLSEWKIFYETWTKTSNTARQISFENFVWAMECVNSRAFSGVFEGSNAQERSSLLFFTGFLTLAWPLLNLGTYEQSISAAVVIGLSIIVRDMIFSKVANLKRYVVCPYVDMFNHKSTCESDCSYNYFSNQFELRTGKYEKGEQVFISYGKQSNDRLLQFYGFIEENNPFDLYDFGLNFIELSLKFADIMTENNPIPTVPSPKERLQKISTILKVSVVDDSTYSGRKVSPLGLIEPTVTADITQTRFFRSVPSDNNNLLESDSVLRRFDDVTVRALRGLFCTPEEFSLLFGEKGGNSIDVLGKPLSEKTEKSVKKALQNIVKNELNSKNTSLEEDMNLFEKTKEKVLFGEVNSEIEGKKGFGTRGEKDIKILENGKIEDSDPSGFIFQDKLLTALKFRIEKKKLLTEALNLLSNEKP